MKYLKACLFAIGIILIVLLITSSLSYFDIINNTFKNILLVIGMIISFFISGLYIGTGCQNKGYLEGIKVGLILVLFFFLLSQFIFRDNISIWKILYYLILFILSIVGSIVGINTKKNN